MEGVKCMGKTKRENPIDPIDAINRRSVGENQVKTVFHQLAEAYTKVGPDIREDLGFHNPVTKRVLSPDKWTSRQIARAKAASADWLDGIKAPSRDPIEAAIDAKDKFLDRLNAALKAGYWEKGLRKTSHAEIVAIVEKLGTRAFEDGIEARERKIKRVVGELQPLVQAVSDSIQGMPDKTDSDREKRLLQARRLMIEVGKKRRA